MRNVPIVLLLLLQGVAIAASGIAQIIEEKQKRGKEITALGLIDDPNFVGIHLDLLETVDAPTPVRATDDVPWRLPLEGAVERLQSINQRQERSTAITQ